VQILNYFLYIFNVFLNPKILMHSCQKCGVWLDPWLVKHRFGQYDVPRSAAGPVWGARRGELCARALQSGVSGNKLGESASWHFSVRSCKGVLCACKKTNTCNYCKGKILQCCDMTSVLNSFKSWFAEVSARILAASSNALMMAFTFLFFLDSSK